MGLVWSGYMNRMWNGNGQRVRPLIFSWSFSRILGLCGLMETNDFSFVSVELHPRLFCNQVVDRGHYSAMRRSQHDHWLRVRELY